MEHMKNAIIQGLLKDGQESSGKTFKLFSVNKYANIRSYAQYAL